MENKIAKNNYGLFRARPYKKKLQNCGFILLNCGLDQKGQKDIWEVKICCNQTNCWREEC